MTGAIVTPREEEIRKQLAPFELDGSEAIDAIIVMLHSGTQPPDLRKALRDILQKYYRGAVPLDAVVGLLAF